MLTLALWAVCLLAATGGHLATAPSVDPAAQMPAVFSVVTSVPGAAIIPARVADDVRAASQSAPLRLLLLAAVLAVLIGLPAAQCRRTSPADRDHQPLRARRHAIALRAPPLQFA